MKRIYQLLLLTAAFAAGACSSGLKSYQKGDYYRSCTEAVDRLRSDPNNGKSRQALQAAYPMAVEDAERQAALAPASRDLRRLEANIGIYEKMNKLAENIIHCPGALRVVPTPKTYYGELRETMDLVGSLYYDQGVSAMSAGTLEAARTAVAYFKKVVVYTPGYKDVDQRLAEAVNVATIRIIVTRPPTPGRYQIETEFFYTKLMNQIAARTYANLVRFYTPEEAAAEGMNNPHQVLALNFADFTVGNTNNTTNTVDCKREDVVVGKTKVNGVDQEVKGTVTAKYTRHRLEVISAGVLNITALSGSTQRIIDQRNFSNKSVWASEWASFNGDERALTDDQRKLVGRKPLPVPPPQELFASFVSPLYAQAASYIGAIYSRI